MDASERVARLDMEDIQRAFPYPTLCLFWIAECDDEELTQAYLRAYNRWTVDFCADSGGRLIPMAQLSLGDPEAAELLSEFGFTRPEEAHRNLILLAYGHLPRVQGTSARQSFVEQLPTLMQANHTFDPVNRSTGPHGLP